MMIYLDYAANTPVDKEVIDAYYDASLKYIGNPNSNHYLGKEALNIINKCTKNIAKMLNVLPEEIIYTSGATESNNLAIKGLCERYKNFGKHLILSSLEHNSIVSSAMSLVDEGFEVDILPVTKEGLVDLETLKKLIRPDTILVSVCAVDSEIGIVQPIKEISEILKEYHHLYFHTDASQAIGKIDVDLACADLVTIAPHKFYGINGTGILIKKQNVSLKPLIHGGKSLTNYRSGTPVLANIVATSKALEIALEKRQDRFNHVKKLNERIINNLKKYLGVKINNTSKSLPYTINFSIKGIKANDIVKMLEEKEIYVSAKTSCCPVQTPSKLVYALTHDKLLASSSIRVSLSHLTTDEEVTIFLKAIEEIIKEQDVNGKV